MKPKPTIAVLATFVLAAACNSASVSEDASPLANDTSTESAPGERFTCVQGNAVESNCRLVDTSDVAPQPGYTADIKVTYDFTCKPGGIPSSIRIYDALDEANGFDLEYASVSVSRVVKTASSLKIKDKNPSETARVRFDPSSCSLKIRATPAPSIEQVQQWATEGKDIASLIRTTLGHYNFRRTVDRFRRAFLADEGGSRATIQEMIAFLEQEYARTGDVTYQLKAKSLQAILDSEDAQIIFAPFQRLHDELVELRKRAETFIDKLTALRVAVEAALEVQYAAAGTELEQPVIPSGQ